MKVPFIFSNSLFAIQMREHPKGTPLHFEAPKPFLRIDLSVLNAEKRTGDLPSFIKNGVHLKHP